MASITRTFGSYPPIGYQTFRGFGKNRYVKKVDFWHVDFSKNHETFGTRWVGRTQKFGLSMPFSGFLAPARHPRYQEHWKRSSSRKVTAVWSCAIFEKSEKPSFFHIGLSFNPGPHCSHFMNATAILRWFLRSRGQSGTPKFQERKIPSEIRFQFKFQLCTPNSRRERSKWS